jgi:hypothetical protein
LNKKEQLTEPADGQTSETWPADVQTGQPKLPMVNLERSPDQE